MVLLLSEHANNYSNNSDNGIALPKKIGVIYSEVKREYFPTESQYITEKNSHEEAEIVAEYIRKMDIEVFLYPGDEGLAVSLQRDKPELVFNLVGSIRGKEYLESAIPAVLELVDIPYTGAGILGESLGYNKFIIKKLQQQAGVPTPAYQLFNSFSDPLDMELRFPLISKLNEIHGAVEITKDAVSENEKHLRDRLKFLINTYKQPALVEEFIAGREITAILLTGTNRKVYMAEKVFNKPNDKYVFATLEDQWGEFSDDQSTWPYTYSKYEDPILKEYIKKAFDVCRMRGYGKFDIRLDYSGRYYFIDSNSNPAFGPKEANVAMSLILDLYGVSFNEILRRVIISSLRPEDLGFSNGNGNGDQGEV